MKYKVRITKKFWSSASQLKKKYSRAEYNDIINEIQESILILANRGYLPSEYQDHVLRRSPYQNYNEYHLYDDDVLVIYVRNDKRLYFRFVEVTDHENLHKNSNSK